MLCACGCGNKLNPIDDSGRTRKFIHGHNKGNLKYCLLDWRKPCECGCGEMIPLVRADRKISRFKNGHVNKGKSLDKNPNWRGGIRKRSDDEYIQIYKPEYKNSNKNGYILLHRYLMEMKLGRDLVEGEIVHHVNGNKTDNRIENLEVLTVSKHNSYHRKEEIKEGRFLGIINLEKYNNSRRR